MSRSRLKMWAVAAAAAAALASAVAAVPAVSASSPPPAPAAPTTAASPAASRAAEVLPVSLAALHALRPAPAARTAGVVPLPGPLLPSQCQVRYGYPCYDAALLRRIYGLDAPPLAGVDGRGVTIELILPYKVPSLAHDVQVYSQQAGLPPADLHTVSVGSPPVASPANPGQSAAALEGILDTETLHAIAPRATILYVQVMPQLFQDPASFTGITSLIGRQQQVMHPAPEVVSVSYGWFEANYAEQEGSAAAGATIIRAQDKPVDAAIRAGLTVVSADGDTGPSGPDLAGTALYTTPTVAAPLADDPLVTAVSGTQVTADDRGDRTMPDTVWSAAGPGGPATGGGLSADYTRPAFQDPYSAVTGDSRGIGDVAMIASDQSPVWVFSSRYQIPGDPAGWQLIAGTSVAAPAFAGIVALADQLAGHPLGAINPALYQLAAGDPAATGIQRVSTGCNTAFGVTGHCATDGPWSLPDGAGTIGSAAQFIRALASTSNQ